MPRFAANLSLLYPEYALLERCDRAAADGFRAVEIQFPYAESPDALAAALQRNTLELVLFNLPAGDWAAGERGIAAHPDRVSEFRAGVARGLELARRLNVPRLNCLAGTRDQAFSLEEQQHTLRENLRYAAEALAAEGRTLLIEPLNRYDVPGFLLNTSREAFALQEYLDAPNLKVQYDVYHMQRGEGELANTLALHLERIGHIQIADTPGRHEPGTGEINYAFLLAHLDRIGYTGWVGLEYIPGGDTSEGLAWRGHAGLE